LAQEKEARRLGEARFKAEKSARKAAEDARRLKAEADLRTKVAMAMAKKTADVEATSEAKYATLAKALEQESSAAGSAVYQRYLHRRVDMPLGSRTSRSPLGRKKDTIAKDDYPRHNFAPPIKRWMAEDPSLAQESNAFGKAYGSSFWEGASAMILAGILLAAYWLSTVNAGNSLTLIGTSAAVLPCNFTSSAMLNLFGGNFFTASPFLWTWSLAAQSVFSLANFSEFNHVAFNNTMPVWALVDGLDDFHVGRELQLLYRLRLEER
jgi:hypothetical protein